MSEILANLARLVLNSAKEFLNDVLLLITAFLKFISNPISITGILIFVIWAIVHFNKNKL